jgi:hypothetical protein
MAGHQRTADTPAGGGRADTPVGGGQAGAALRTADGHALHACAMGYGGKGGCGYNGGSPDVEAGKMPVTPIRFGPRGYFTQISITTPIVSALKNYYI